METSPNLRMTFLARFIYSHPSIQATFRVHGQGWVLQRPCCLHWTSTPRLFVELYLGVCGNKVKNQRWWQWLAYSKMPSPWYQLKPREADSYLIITILPEAGSQDLTSCQVRNRVHIQDLTSCQVCNRAHIVRVKSYVLIANAHPSVQNCNSVCCHPQVCAGIFEG